jgi:acyl-coenzyme A synthetase/AMP-(fatty) acid ligase
MRVIAMNNPCFFRYSELVDFKTLSADINSAREGISSYSIKKVILFHTDSYQFTVLFFALLLEGKDVLLPPNKQIGTLQQLSTQCDATAGEINLKNKTKIIIHPAIEQSLAPKNINSTTELFSQLSAMHLAQVTFFTSGSTGQPKAIVKQCQQLLCELDTLSTSFADQLDTAGIIVSTVSHQHIYGLLFKILLPLYLGKIVANKTFEYPEHIYEDLADVIFNPLADSNKNIILVSSPAHLKRLVLDNVLSKYAEYYSTTFSSGGLLPHQASKLYAEQMGKAPIEVFGSTETGGIAWRYGNRSKDTPWRVFKNISYSIEQESNRLIINSPYINEQAYVTDDCVEPINATHFILKGRVDRTIKLEEKRINLDHLEQCLVAHPWVNDAKVFMVKSHKNLARSKVLSCALAIDKSAAAIVENKGKRSLNEIFKQHLLNDFERICLPKKWRYLEKFPYNSQGKLVLKDLEYLFD